MRISLSARPSASVGLIVAFLLSGCNERSALVAPPTGSPAGAASASSAPVFSWLAPLGTGVGNPATFDALAAPTIDVCLWSAGACVGAPIARFSTTPVGAELPLTINSTVGQYQTDWSLLSTSFTTRKTYRIRAQQQSVELGAVLVDVVRGRWALTRSDGTLAPLTSANALAIRFSVARIITNVSATIGSAGGSVSLPDGPRIDVVPGGIQGEVTFALSKVTSSLRASTNGASMSPFAIAALQSPNAQFQLDMTVLAGTTFTPNAKWTLSLPLTSGIQTNQAAFLRGQLDGHVLWKPAVMDLSTGYATSSFGLASLNDLTAIHGNGAAIGMTISAEALATDRDQPDSCAGYPSLDLSQVAINAQHYAIVFVHGWLPEVEGCSRSDHDDFATALANGTLPGDKYFKNLLAYLAPRVGNDASRYVFTYPTYRDFTSVGIDLKAKIIQRFGVNGSDAQADGIILVGHSMGGLVARTAARLLVSEDPQWKSRIKGIITLATPHTGTIGPENIVADWFVDHIPFVDAGGLLTPGAQSLLPPTALPGALDAFDVPIVAYGGNMRVCNPYFILNNCSAPYSALGFAASAMCIRGVCNTDGAVSITSAVPSFLPVANQRLTGVWSDYNHEELLQERSGSTGFFDAVLLDIQRLAPPPTPEFVIGIGNTASLLVTGNILFALVSDAGTSGSAVHLYQTSIGSATFTEPLGPRSPGLGIWARDLRIDGTHLYWSAAGVRFSEPFTIRRLPLGGTVVETIVDTLPLGQHYELYQNDIYMAVRYADNTQWVKRVSKTGGSVTNIVQVSGYAGFAVGNDEVFYEDCTTGTVRAQSINGGFFSRPIASGLDVSNQCSDNLFIVGNTLYVVQTLGSGSLIRSVPVTGGSLVTKVAGLVNPVDVVFDNTYLFLRDLPEGTVIRYRLSDFSRKVMAARSCGGLTLDATHVYWASELAPAPAQMCYDGGSGPVVRLPKDL